MRFQLCILIPLSFAINAFSQNNQLIYRGEANWKKVVNQQSPVELPVIEHVYKVTKKVSQNSSRSITQAKIDPKSILIHNGPTIPSTQKIKFTGKKITAPIALDASPLLSRDNATFNISYADKQHGFPGNFTTDFAEDDQHNIWISSDNGLYKYDGYHYYLYNQKNGVPSMPNLSMLFDKQHRLWLASDSGVYFIQHDSLFSLKSEELDFSKVPSFKVQSDRFDKIWLSTKKNGAVSIDGNNIQVYDKRCGLFAEYILTTHVDKNGNILIGANNTGLFVIEANKMRLLFSTSNNMKVHSILSLYEDEDGIWIGGFLSGMFRMGQKDTIQYSISGKYNERIFDIKKAPRGGLWLASYSSELCYFDKKNLLIINENNGLINRFPYFLFQDSFNNLWVSNLQSGYSRVNENAFYVQKNNNDAIGNIKTIIPDNKKGKWIITHGKNLLYQKGNTTTSFSIIEKYGIDPFGFLLDGLLNDDGSLWVGNYGGGLTLVTDSLYKSYYYSNFPENGIINSIKRDYQNKVWFSPGDFGLIYYDKNKFWRYTQKSGLLSNNVKHVFLDNKKQINWTFENGFQRLNNGSIETMFIGNTLLKDQVNGMLVVDAKTTILATSENGLLFLKNNKTYQLSSASGLSSNNIKTIIQDTNGTIWISTDKGIESFKTIGSGKENEIAFTEHQIFNTSNGNYILDAENVFLDSTGSPNWTVKDKSLVLNPTFLKKIKSVPVFSFQSFYIDNKKLAQSSEISILPNQKIQIDFTTIYWGRENNLSIKYLLISDRGDTSINAIGEKGHITISEILPGKYNIILSAEDNNQLFFSRPIFIQINNFWYNTWLFRIIGLCVLLILLVGYFRQKAKRQININRLLKIKVDEQTEEIFKEKEELIESHQIINKQIGEKDLLIQEINHRVKNNLQFILAMVEMQMGADFKKDPIESLMGTSRRITAMSLVHEMLYDNNEVQVLSIKKYIYELIENLKELANDNQNPVEIKTYVEDFVLDSKTAIALGMIISELVSNSFKHAFKKIKDPKIIVQLFHVPTTDQLCLSVSDNGNGIEGECLSKRGFGMQMIDIFSRQLEGEYTIDCQVHFTYELNFKQQIL